MAPLVALLWAWNGHVIRDDLFGAIVALPAIMRLGG
jgi:hypothetical protein